MQNIVEKQQIDQEDSIVPAIEALFARLDVEEGDLERSKAIADFLMEHLEYAEDALFKLLCAQSIAVNASSLGIAIEDVDRNRSNAILAEWSSIYDEDDIVLADDGEEEDDYELSEDKKEKAEHVLKMLSDSEFIGNLREKMESGEEDLESVITKIQEVALSPDLNAEALHDAIPQILNKISHESMFKVVITTIAYNENPDAMKWLLHMLYYMQPDSVTLDAIEMIKIATICCSGGATLPVKTLTKIVVNGGHHNALPVRLAAAQIVQRSAVIEVLKPEALAQFVSQAVSSILRNCENKPTNDDNTVIEELLFGVSYVDPMLAGALCSKFGPRLSNDIKAKIKLWSSGKLHLCTSAISRDLNNMDGLSENGFLYEWNSESNKCGDASHSHH